jgi:hypothetical protein
VALGLTAATGGLVLFATATAASGYGHYILAMVIVCAGMRLAMSAATSASTQELPQAMAGVGSALNDTTRNMGSVGAACGRTVDRCLVQNGVSVHDR